MDFGMLHLFESPAGKSEHRVMKEQLDIMRAAEDLGFDSVWPAEHHFSEYGFCASPALSLAAIAQVTKRIRLGTGIVILPFHNPIRAAEEYAMVDLMSDGRLEFGVGRGYQPTEFKGFGVDQEHSRELFHESLEIIMQAWTKPEVNYKGKHFNIEGVSVRPHPYQKPTPPVWMASLSESSFPLVGKYGFNLLSTSVFNTPASRPKEMIDQYWAAIRAGGHDPAKRKIANLCMVYCAETTEQARREFEGPVLWYYRTIAKYVAPPPGTAPVKGYEVYAKTRDVAAHASWEQLLANKSIICGDRDHCIEEIARLQKELGFHTLLCWTRLGGMDQKKVQRSMEMMQKYVIPNFKREQRKVA